ncbi:hypothetical protein [uncultured Kordia sp.]|uniref:hypothetical protein n=1 Tax=uncultured Kordia sp. TaxID=507699 RepID=UPI00261E3FF0|nr:hypothetical protein [uncultured Kordia sp.]
MKRRSLKSLELNKKSISNLNLNEVRGGLFRTRLLCRKSRGERLCASEGSAYC